MLRIFAPLLAVFLLSTGLQADALRVEQVTQSTYAIIGPLSQRSPENLGNNATFGLIVTSEGAILIDAGGTYKGAAQLHAAIRSVTDQPVVLVINSGGQDHRWLGNGYWHDQGARIVASLAAVADQTDRVSLQLTGLAILVGPEGLEGTEPVYADVTYTGTHQIEIGGVTLLLTHGAAHTPGETYVWFEQDRVMFTGDMVYMERILGVGPMSSTIDWVDSFQAMAAYAPAHIVPGHGGATDLAGATADTYDYLVNLRTKMAAFIEDGGDIIDAPKIDQSAFSYLQNFEGLAGRNAQEAYAQMEWE